MSEEEEQVIYLSAGAVEYTFPTILTETSGKDISADTVQVCLGGYSDPTGDWQDPDVLTRPTTSSVSAQILVGEALKPPTGSYYVWVKISDAPEIPARRGPGRVNIA